MRYSTFQTFNTQKCLYLALKVCIIDLRDSAMMSGEPVAARKLQVEILEEWTRELVIELRVRVSFGGSHCLGSRQF